MSIPGQYGIAGIVLAAGESSRMGMEKALLPWPVEGGTFLHAILRRLQPYTQFLIVVASPKNADALKTTVYSQGASLVVNPTPEKGQFSSLRVGLQEVLARGRDAALITHVDRPPAQPATMESLLLEFNATLGHPSAQRKWLMVPECGGAHGHPVLAGREMMEAWLRAPETTTAREVEHQHQDRIEYVPVKDIYTVMNINTPEEYERFKRAGESQ